MAGGTLFTIEAVDSGPPAQFRCAGELDLAGTSLVTEALTPITSGDVVLEFSQVTFLDSAGIGALVAQQTRLRSEGHRLRLVGLQDAPRRSLETLGLLDELT